MRYNSCNCDSTLFLGGKEIIDLNNKSETRSNQKSFGLNYQKTGNKLICQDEITVWMVINAMPTKRSKTSLV